MPGAAPDKPWSCTKRPARTMRRIMRRRGIDKFRRPFDMGLRGDPRAGRWARQKEWACPRRQPAADCQSDRHPRPQRTRAAVPADGVTRKWESLSPMRAVFCRWRGLKRASSPRIPPHRTAWIPGGVRPARGTPGDLVRTTGPAARAARTASVNEMRFANGIPDDMKSNLACSNDYWRDADY